MHFSESQTLLVTFLIIMNDPVEVGNFNVEPGNVLSN